MRYMGCGDTNPRKCLNKLNRLVLELPSLDSFYTGKVLHNLLDKQEKLTIRETIATIVLLQILLPIACIGSLLDIVNNQTVKEALLLFH